MNIEHTILVYCSVGCSKIFRNRIKYMLGIWSSSNYEHKRWNVYIVHPSEAILFLLPELEGEGEMFGPYCAMFPGLQS